MSGEVSPMLWFLFWVGLSAGVLSFGFFMAIIIHRGNMKALEVLRTYAEKGIEPPPAIIEMLTRHLSSDEAAKTGQDIGKKAGSFTGLVAAACVAGAIAWWRMNAGGPQWVVYVFAASAVFWGVYAIAYLFRAFTSSGK
jgi:hypothetical protein